MTAPWVAQVLERARSAQPAWGSLPLSHRVPPLARLRRQIAASRDRIVSALVSDTGKPPLDALGGDVLVTLEQMLYYERHAARLLRPRRVRAHRLFASGAFLREIYEPHGVALVYGPSNYPFQLSVVPAVTALYAGNAVVLKVSDRAPLVAELISALAREAGLPDGLLQVVSDTAPDAASYIDAGPDVLFFTGSSANGRQVAQRAAARLIPVVLELGGKDPAIVFADCNAARTVEGIVYGAFSNAGQVCVGIKRLYVEQSIYAHFLNLLAERTARLRVGTDVDCDLGNLRGGPAIQLFHAQVVDAVDRGARLHTPRLQKSPPGSPVILSGVAKDARLLTEETFGPVLCVQPFETEAEAIHLANASPFALGASVWTRDLSRARRVSLQLRAGTCAINDVIRPIAHPDAAFGGNAASGYGRYHGQEGLRAFSRIKTLMTTRAARTREVNWFPAHGKYTGLDKLLELRHRPHGMLSALRKVAGLAPLPVLLLFLLPIPLPALFLAVPIAASQSPAHLWLHVELPPNSRGNLAYLVFNSPDGFPQNSHKALKHGFIQRNDTRPVVNVDIGALPPGRYAVSIYLDENDNRKLDTNLLGIPHEPVGASNDPRPRMGPPRFADCAFQMGAATRTITIHMVETR